MCLEHDFLHRVKAESSTWYQHVVRYICVCVCIHTRVHIYLYGGDMCLYVLVFTL